MKLSEAADLFYLSMRTVRSSATIEWYEKKLNSLIDFLSDPDLDAIDLFALENFRASLDRPSLAKGRGGIVSCYTVHGYVRAIKRFFTWCRFRRLIKDSPAEFLEKPKLPKQPRKGIRAEDAEKMLQIAAEESKRDYAMLLFFRDTGCRAGGVYNLMTRDLDIEHNIATIHEKGDKERIVFYTAETAYALTTYMIWRENPLDLPNFFLANGGNGHHQTALNYEGVYRIFRRLARKAGIEDKFSPHQWRHAAIRSWLKAGMNLKSASEIAGHSSEKVTGDIYGTLNEDELHALYNRTLAVIEASRAGDS